MESDSTNWPRWCHFFASRSDRQLPELEDSYCYANIPSSVAKSLAIFQLGESGGGSIIEQARRSHIAAIDRHYANALELFVNEEHRHAEILAICIRNLGGTLIRKNWTARLFVFGRRLIGLRLKVMVLLAAEVVGICYYHLLATRLPQSRLKSLLAQLVNDERAHLHFHCAFLRSQTSTAWRRLVFRAAWRSIMVVAAAVVLLDHRTVLRDLDLAPQTVWRRWMSYSNLAERLITTGQDCGDEDLQILAQSSQPSRNPVAADPGARAMAEFSLVDAKSVASR